MSPFVITSTWNYPSLHYSLDYQLRQVFPAAPCPLSPILICPVDGEFLPLIIINSTPTEILLSHTQFSSKFNLRLGLSCVNFGLVVTDLCTSEANERWGKFTMISRTALPPPWKSHLDNWILFKIKFWIFPLKIKFSNLSSLIFFNFFVVWFLSIKPLKIMNISKRVIPFYCNGSIVVASR